MAKKTKKLNIDELESPMERIEVSIETCKIGETIFIERDDKVSYTILDIGSPFILILNDITNFAHLYKCTKVYKNKIIN